MVNARRWLLVGLVLSLFCSLGLAEDASADWKILQAADLCLRFPSDWYDMTPIIRLVLLPELFSGMGMEGIELPAAIMRLPSTLEGEPAFVVLLFVDDDPLPQLLAAAADDSDRIERSEVLVAGEPGIFERYETDYPEGLAWLAYTRSPRSDGRHVVLLAMSPAEALVPEATIREILLSVGPCPPPPTEPPCVAEERVAALERDLQELRRAHQAEIDTLRDAMAALERDVGRLHQSRELRIGVVDVETLFTRVFLPQVQTERAAMEAKRREIQALQSNHTAGQVSLEAYQQRYLRLQAELIQVSLHVNLTMLDKMIASPGFLAMRSDLESVRAQAKPIGDEVAAVVKEAQVTILDMAAFSERLQTLQAAFQQLDQLLTKVAAAKMVEITQQVAREKGYDLVVRTKDVVMFRRESTIVDLSSEVEPRLWALFPSQ